MISPPLAVPIDEVRRSAANRRQQAYFDYRARQSFMFHFDRLRLALKVLDLCEESPAQAQWLLCIEEAADHCLREFDSYTDHTGRPFPYVSKS